MLPRGNSWFFSVLRTITGQTPDEQYVSNVLVLHLQIRYHRDREEMVYHCLALLWE
jgi:hypothetical protein